MKILIFTEGTILMHKSAVGHSREEIIEQVKDKQSSVKDYSSYVPIGNAVDKLNKWKAQGADVIYLTSRKEQVEINDIRNILSKFNFPKGGLVYRKQDEGYKDVAERIMPDLLIEDNCESIGGEDEMTITHISEDKKTKIKSIIIKEFNGIDHLSDNVLELV